MNMKIFLLNYLQNYYFYEIFLNFNYSREGKTRCKIKSIPLPKKNRVEKPISGFPSHTTVQALSHTAVSDLC